MAHQRAVMCSAREPRSSTASPAARAAHAHARSTNTLGALDDDTLQSRLMHASADSLQVLSCTCRRLRAAIRAEPFRVARIRAGIAAIEIKLTKSAEAPELSQDDPLI